MGLDPPQVPNSRNRTENNHNQYFHTTTGFKSKSKENPESEPQQHFITEKQTNLHCKHKKKRKKSQVNIHSYTHLKSIFSFDSFHHSLYTEEVEEHSYQFSSTHILLFSPPRSYADGSIHTKTTTKNTRPECQADEKPCQ